MADHDLSEVYVRFLITGSRGQLGSAFAQLIPEQHRLPYDLPELDVTDLAATRQIVQDAKVQVVIHCAAFTDVDGCTLDPDKAQFVNACGSRNVAYACAESDTAMVLISTNEVFDGTKPGAYCEVDKPNPINSYGISKLAAELSAQRILERLYIVRTSWMYSKHGSNFIHKIQKLADERESLSVVSDELGAPTWSRDLALAIIDLIKTEKYGVYHLVNSGHTSRFDLARMVLDLTSRNDIAIDPIGIADYKRVSKPPRNGVLENVNGALIGIRLRPWDEALREFLRVNSS